MIINYATIPIDEEDGPDMKADKIYEWLQLCNELESHFLVNRLRNAEIDKF